MAKLQNGEYYKTANLTKRRIWKEKNSENQAEYVQIKESYKTANLKENSENQAEYIQFKEYYKDYKTANLTKKILYTVFRGKLDHLGVSSTTW